MRERNLHEYDDERNWEKEKVGCVEEEEVT